MHVNMWFLRERESELDMSLSKQQGNDDGMDPLLSECQATTSKETQL